MSTKDLKQAARACRIALSYEGSDKQKIRAKDETIEKVLLALTGINDAKNIIADLRKKKITRGLPAVIICWDGTSSPIWLWNQSLTDNISAELSDENGKTLSLNVKIEDHVHREGIYRLKLSSLRDLVSGYYNLKITAGDQAFETLVISAPSKLKISEKSWGVFAPAYAIRSSGNQGIGGFKELFDTAVFTKQQGGSFIGTLPLLPVYHESNDNSPYSPISRFFWNEIFLDLDQLPHFAAEERDFDELNKFSHVDYQAVYEAKKKIIRKASDEFFKFHAQDDKVFQKFFSEKPYLKDYAAFYSDGKDVNYHLYAQYACHLQIEKFKNGGAAQLYLDYPVGVHPNGFDSQKFSHLFMDRFSVGAPPDKLGPKGQNWGFKPLNPISLINDKFLYFRHSIQHYFRYAKMVRIDHVMSLYRLYCIPEGEASSNGAYIYYPFHALLAILCLETARHDGVIIGENLGTVPAAVNDAMEKHSILRMWISQFELEKDPEKSFKGIDRDMIAGLNTHDMFPFQSVTTNSDLSELSRLGILNEKDVVIIKREREALLKNWSKEESSFLGLLEKMAASTARFVIVNMEDLWQETMPQNIPGTISEYPNWSKKFSVSSQEWSSHPYIKKAFSILNKYRGQS